jgi:hypothetical protein
MHIGRSIIISAILAISVAGAVLPGAEIAMAATHSHGAHAHTTAPLEIIGTYYHT